MKFTFQPPALERSSAMVLPLSPSKAPALGEVVQVTARTQRTMILDRLHVASTCGHCYVLTSFHIAGRDILRGTPSDAGWFTAAAMGPTLGATVLRAGEDVIIDARAARPMPLAFRELERGGPVPLFWLTPSRLRAWRPLVRGLFARAPIPPFRAVLIGREAPHESP